MRNEEEAYGECWEGYWENAGGILWGMLGGCWRDIGERLGEC